MTTFLRDDLNSVRRVDSSTLDFTPDKTFNYFAYGDLRDGDPIQNLDFGYTGRVRDELSGLYNYRGRYYSSCSGSFTQVDPMRDGSNWYAYTGGLGDPVIYNDPTGYGIQFIVGGVLIGGLYVAHIGYVWATENERLQDGRVCPELDHKDKYHHCMANCRVTRTTKIFGIPGTIAAGAFHEFRKPKDVYEDTKANLAGAFGGVTQRNYDGCHDFCYEYAESLEK